MRKILPVILSLFVVIGCDDKASSGTTATSNVSQQVLTKADFAKYVREGVEYDVSSTGVLTFAKPYDMFEDFNDFYEDEFKIVSESPLSILMTKKLTDSHLEPFKEWNERSVLYAVYKTFTYTPANEIIIEAYPISEQKNGKMKAHKEFTLKGKVSREKALDVLKKHSPATSFDDLVQLEQKEGSYRRVGVSGSDTWDKFYHNEQTRSEIIKDLLQ